MKADNQTLFGLANPQLNHNCVLIWLTLDLDVRKFPTISGITDNK